MMESMKQTILQYYDILRPIKFENVLFWENLNFNEIGEPHGEHRENGRERKRIS